MTSKNVFKAILAEKVERYELVIETVVAGKDEADALLPEEVELLCIAYKSLVDRDRTAVQALRNFWSADGKVESNELFEHYLDRLTKRAVQHCHAFLEVLEKSLIDVDPEDFDTLIQRKKTIADYYRYICELKKEAMGITSTSKAEFLYKELLKLAEEHLESLSTLYLTVCINYAVFQYEIKGDRQKALSFLSEKFERALNDLNTVKEDNVKEIMQLMTYMDDNIKDWTKELKE